MLFKMKLVLDEVVHEGMKVENEGLFHISLLTVDGIASISQNLKESPIGAIQSPYKFSTFFSMHILSTSCNGSTKLKIYLLRTELKFPNCFIIQASEE